jgi:preprotein translocase subunit SecG
MADRRGFSFRDSAITFAFMVAVVAALAVGVLVLLDPRSQAFWGAKFSDLGTAARALVSQLPWMR